MRVFKVGLVAVTAFFLFVLPVSAALPDIDLFGEIVHTQGDYSVYRDWEILNSSSLAKSAVKQISVSFDGSSWFEVSSNQVIVKAYASSSGSISSSDICYGSLVTDVTLAGGSYYLISGEIKVGAMDFPASSFKGFKNFNSWFSGVEIKFFQVSAKQFSSSSDVDQYACFDAVVYVPATVTFDFHSYFSLEGSYPKGSCGNFYWTNFTFDEIAPHQNSIEEWLKLIYEGLTGKDENGNSTVTDPDIAAGLVSGNDAQGQIDSFEQNITGQFNSSFTDLNLDGFQITGGTLAALSFVSGWVMSFFNASGDLKMIILLPLFIGLALLLIGRGSMAMVRVRSKNNRNKGGGS